MCHNQAQKSAGPHNDIISFDHLLNLLNLRSSYRLHSYISKQHGYSKSSSSNRAILRLPLIQLKAWLHTRKHNFNLSTKVRRRPQQTCHKTNPKKLMKDDLAKLAPFTSKDMIEATSHSLADTDSINDDTMPSPVISVFRSIARQARGVARQIVRVPTKSMSRMSGEQRPDMAKMRQVTPIYDHDLKRWVWPTPPMVHQDELLGKPCKQMSASSKADSRRSSK